MNLLHSILVSAIAVTLAGSARAAQLSGKIATVSGANATITMDGDVLPNVGDRINVFFRLGKAEVGVGEGEIVEAKPGTIKARIDHASGTVARDQLVRIEPDRKLQTDETHAPKANNLASDSIEGDWTASAPGNAKVSFSFRPDHTLLWVVDEPGSPKAARGKYSINISTRPNGIEISELDAADMKGQILRGKFELQGDGRLKLDLSDEAGFSDKQTLLFSRAATPVMLPPARSDSGSANTPAAPTILDGAKLELDGDIDGAIKIYTVVINLKSNDAAGYSARGYAFARKGDYESAVADWTKAATLDSSLAGELSPLIENLKSQIKYKTRTPEMTRPSGQSLDLTHVFRAHFPENCH